MNNTILEYIWIDGVTPTSSVRSKIKVIADDPTGNWDSKVFPIENPEELVPGWGFDGSSTEQAEGGNSDCVLRPVRVYKDPIKQNALLVMCEVLNVDGTPHVSNTRSALVETMGNYGQHEPLVGIEQEYTLYSGSVPLGWPEDTLPPPQGDYYCGRNAGEAIMLEHLLGGLEAGISMVGTNAEVMLGQWEYQVGTVDPLRAADDLWVARWLMEKIAAQYDVSVSLDPKPVKGDWNGAGAHTNFSTKEMRDAGGYSAIEAAIEKLGGKHHQHMEVYGAGNERRLTGKHETCAMNMFKWGVSDRGASVRVPWQVKKEGCGYLEDRRPSSNCDPYRVLSAIITTICG